MRTRAQEPRAGTVLRRLLAVPAVALALTAAGCGVSPTQSDAPASTTCDADGSRCAVHLVRGAAPQELGRGSRRFALRLGPARDRTVEMATRKSAGTWAFTGAFGAGSGTVGAKDHDISVERVDVDSAEAEVVFHRGRGE